MGNGFIGKFKSRKTIDYFFQLMIRKLLHTVCVCVSVSSGTKINTFKSFFPILKELFNRFHNKSVKFVMQTVELGLGQFCRKVGVMLKKTLFFAFIVFLELLYKGLVFMNMVSHDVFGLFGRIMIFDVLK
jgi:hypothetical protein